MVLSIGTDLFAGTSTQNGRLNPVPFLLQCIGQPVEFLLCVGLKFALKISKPHLGIAPIGGVNHGLYDMDQMQGGIGAAGDLLGKIEGLLGVL